MEQDEEKLNKTLDEFAEKKLLPAVGKMMDEKLSNYPTKEDLSNHPTKADLDVKLSNYPTKEDLSNHPTKADLDEKLSNHPTKADLDEKLSNHPTKADLDVKLSNYPTKEDLANHPTKADLDEKLRETKYGLNQRITETRDELMKMFAGFTDEVLLPGINKTVQEIITEELRSYPTKLDLENALRENREEIIAEIRRKIEPIHRHQVIVTDVIEEHGCANSQQLEILKESVL